MGVGIYIMRFGRLTLLVLFIGLLAGCSAVKKQGATSTKPKMSKIEQELLSTARSIEKSLGTLSLTTNNTALPLLNTSQLVTPEGGMGGTADIDWTGPLAPLIKKIADLSDYHIKVLGKEPAIPIMVSIVQSKAVIADILKNAGLQAGRRANIMVFPQNRIIELRYTQS